MRVTVVRRAPDEHAEPDGQRDRGHQQRDPPARGSPPAARPRPGREPPRAPRGGRHQVAGRGVRDVAAMKAAHDAVALGSPRPGHRTGRTARIRALVGGAAGRASPVVSMAASYAKIVGGASNSTGAGRAPTSVSRSARSRRRRAPRSCPAPPPGTAAADATTAYTGSWYCGHRRRLTTVRRRASPRRGARVERIAEASISGSERGAASEREPTSANGRAPGRLRPRRVHPGELIRAPAPPAGGSGSSRARGRVQVLPPSRGADRPDRDRQVAERARREVADPRPRRRRRPPARDSRDLLHRTPNPAWLPAPAAR